MPLRVFVFGRTGQVGSALSRCSSPGLQVVAIGRDQADLTDPDACAAAIKSAEADIIVNAAAYTAVDDAETDHDQTMLVNARAPGAMAEAAHRRGLPFIHLSTDYVFDGQSERPWRETDVPSPINLYGATKRLGEQAVIGANPNAVILRTSWVFSPDGSNFVRTMLNAARSNRHLSIVNDQIGCPTPADAIAVTILRIAEAFASGRGQRGIFHYCGAPRTTWYEFAQNIFHASGSDSPRLIAIRSEQWPTPAARPRYSVLDCGLIYRTYGIRQPDWNAALKRIVPRLENEAA